MADSTVSVAPTTIQLWFSAPIQIRVTTVRVQDSAGRAVAMAPAHIGDGALAPVIADVKGRLAPGRYTVTWRTMSRDGHVVRGTFAFMLASQPAHSR